MAPEKNVAAGLLEERGRAAEGEPRSHGRPLDGRLQLALGSGEDVKLADLA